MKHQKVTEYPDPAQVKDYLNKKYSASFRVDNTTWKFLPRTCGHRLQHQGTHYREPIGSAKRLAIILKEVGPWKDHDHEDWRQLCHRCVYCPLHCSPWHQGPKRLPGQNSNQISGKSRANRCAGRSLPQGRTEVPCQRYGWYFCPHAEAKGVGHTHWCYKNYMAVLLLAVCDHRRKFTYIDVTRAGLAGDGYACNHSTLKAKIDASHWLKEDYASVAL